MFCMFTCKRRIKEEGEEDAHLAQGLGLPWWGGLVVCCQLVVELWIETLMTDAGVGC